VGDIALYIENNFADMELQVSLIDILRIIIIFLKKTSYDIRMYIVDR